MDLSAAFAATLPAARTRDAARYAIGGAVPQSALAPATREEAAEVLRACAADRLALVPWGGGVALARAAAPARYDVALDLTQLNRVTTYDPDDFTITAECGITLATLRETLGAHGQELPLEGAEAWGATLGGVLAANASGPRRLRFGAPRDRILGAAFALGDGTLARSGGRVVKNVAGHAVHRLLVGSHGALGVLLEASLKLLPQPPARAALVHGVDDARIADRGLWAPFARREPAVLTVLGRAVAALNPVLACDAPFTVVSGFEDDAAWVEVCREFVHERLGPARISVRDASVPPLWQMLTDTGEMPGPRLTFTTAHNSPAALAPLCGRPVAERLVFHAPAGRLHLWPEAGEADALVRELAGLGFALLEARGAGIERVAPPAAITALRARLSRALDPAEVMAFGASWRPGPAGPGASG